MNRAMQILLIIAGLLVLLCSLLPWLAAYAVILASSGGEYHGILESDKPVAYNLLEFDEWQDGPGDCTPSHIHGFGADYRILAHRVGRADGVFTQFTYYEARYLTPRGQERITHASGTEPLISPRRPILWTLTLSCLVGSIFLLRGAWKLSKTDSQHHPDISEPMDLNYRK